MCACAVMADATSHMPVQRIELEIMSEKLPQTPSFRLDGKRALVTGAGRGLGLAGAAALAQAGAHVTLCARSLHEIEALRDAIIDSGGSADVLQSDVTDASGFKRHVSARDGYDILLNNAGTNRPKPFVDVTEDDYDAVSSLNLRAAFFVAQAIAQGMIDQKRKGSIIHVSSQMGHVGGPNRSIYCATKWGLEGLSKSIALDLAPHGIRVNTIAPTFIETPMTKPFFENVAFKASVLEKIKLGRLGTLEDVMGPIVFLASDASALMTGSAVMIDGGWTAE